MPTPAIPGAINLTVEQLSNDQIVAIGTGGQAFAQTTLGNLAEFLQADDVGPAEGTFTMNGATPVVVDNAAVTADSVILYSLKTVGGTPAASQVTALAAGVSFTVTGTAGDTSIYNYKILG